MPRPLMRPILLLTAAAAAALFPHCAAEGPPPGGPEDREGPRVVMVTPPSGTTGIDPDQTIEIAFDEPVDPVSVPGSLRFMPEMDFTVRVRSRRVVIRPEGTGPAGGGFQKGQVVVLTLSRGIRDYRKNPIPKAYQFVFSTGPSIPNGTIHGRITNHSPARLVEVGLYALGSSRSTASDRTAQSQDFVLTQTIDLNNDGTFSFAFLPEGPYRIAAVEGGLVDIGKEIRLRPYALPARDTLLVQAGDTTETTMRLSPPLLEPQIQEVTWISPTYVRLTFNQPFEGGAIPPEGLYPTQDNRTYGYLPSNFGDTTRIEVGQAFNRLGRPYEVHPISLATPAIVDTLPPTLSPPNKEITFFPPARDHPQWKSLGLGRLLFSEPITLPAGLTATLTGDDTLRTELIQDTPLTLQVEAQNPERFRKLVIEGWQITDQAGNRLSDSLLVLAANYQPPEAAGSIRGRLLGLQKAAVVEARIASSGELASFALAGRGGAADETTPSSYHFPALPPGFYTLFAHEQRTTQTATYFSGQWEPYQRAARFAAFPQEVEVRARWEVDGIDINFQSAPTAQSDSSLR